MQQMVRSNFGYVFLLVAAITTAAVYAVDRHGNLSPSPKVVDPLYDPDEGSITEDAVPLFDTVSGEEACKSVGGTNVQLSPRTFAYRGNVFRITSETVVESFSMALSIASNQSNDLQFTIHERLTNGTFTLINSIFQINVSGSGMLSSGLFIPAVTLNAGSDYALGVAWGASDTVYFRNGIRHPVDFVTGQVLGLIGFSVLGLPIEDLAALQIGITGAYGMDVCIKPAAGACCTDGGCNLLLETECTDTGSYFHGDRTKCSEKPCNFGACCFPCQGECSGLYTPEACEADGGVNHWPGIECPSANNETLCPPVTGVCCIDSEPFILCERDCLDPTVGDVGIYHGDGTDNMNLCVGACCAPDECTDINKGLCDFVIDSVYHGDGTSCNRLDPDIGCGNTGACCFTIPDSPQDCRDNKTRLECTESPGGIPDAIFLGEGSTCADTCPADENVGACCLPNGTCMNTTQAYCIQEWVAGEFSGPLRCVDIVCTLEACCHDEDGSCEITTNKACEIYGGTPVIGETDCAAAILNQCRTPASEHVCCFSNGVCDLITELLCEADGGLFNPGLDACDSLTCPGFGACCIPDGQCLENTSMTDCETVFSEEFAYRGDSFTCSQITDCDQRGACCTLSGNCQYILQIQCDEIGGDFSSIGNQCIPNETCASGACCTGDRTCEFLTQLICDSPDGGVYQGSDTTCEDNLCILGACCKTNGSCADLFESQCSEEGDFFTVDSSCSVIGSTCEPAEACCFNNETCQLLRELDCLDFGGNFIGGGATRVTCNETTCDFGSCCRSDGQCDNFSVDQECSGANEQFSSESFCSELNPLCSAVGACCQLDGSCTELRELDCSDVNGLFQGTDTTCNDSGVCSIGACCEDGTCNPKTELNCTNLGGVYNGDDVPCTAGLCELRACCQFDGDCVENTIESQCNGPAEEFLEFNNCGDCSAKGSCCVDDTCSEHTIIFCEDTIGGNYGGDGTTCEPDLCTVGACCMPNGGCNDTFTLQQCILSEGFYQGIGLDCAPLRDAGTCERGACCDLNGNCFDDTVVSECDASSTFTAGDTCNDIMCNARGACCAPKNMGCEVLTRTGCSAIEGAFSDVGVPCEEDLCFDGACCKADESCELMARLICESNGDSYKGVDTICGIEICSCQPVLFITDPPNCAIDARYPHELLNASAALGWNPLIIGFDCDQGVVLPEDFLITGTNPPNVVTVEPSGDPNTFLVTLSHPIAPGVWTQIEHVPGGSFMNIGALPGDANNDGLSDQNDITFLIEALNGNIAPVALWQCDIDHSTTCTPADILALINLLNGAEMFDIWMNATLPVCPTGGP